MTGYEQERDRGADAQALLDSPLLNTALDAIEREFRLERIFQSIKLRGQMPLV